MFLEHGNAKILHRMHVFFSFFMYSSSSQREVFSNFYFCVFLDGGYLLAYNREEAAMPGMIIVQE